MAVVTSVSQGAERCTACRILLVHDDIPMQAALETLLTPAVLFETVSTASVRIAAVAHLPAQPAHP